MSAKSFCASYHMDLVSLESQHETQYFMKACEGNFDSFGKISLIGGVDEGDNEWSTSALGVKMNLDATKVEDIDKEGKCLSLIKNSNKKFSYGRVACTNQPYAFVCQRMKLKLEHWTDIFGR